MRRGASLPAAGGTRAGRASADFFAGRSPSRSRQARPSGSRFGAARRRVKSSRPVSSPFFHQWKGNMLVCQAGRR
jgi:hypothetical protein